MEDLLCNDDLDMLNEFDYFCDKRIYTSSKLYVNLRQSIRTSEQT